MADFKVRRAVIVGSRGQMGAMFKERFRDQGIDVLGLDRPITEDRMAEILPEADLVMISVPVTAMGEVVREVVPYMREDAILSDLCSVKTLPMKAMVEAHNGPVVGTHPLFGPVIPEGFTPRVAVVPGAGTDPTPVSDIMSACGFTPFISTSEEHDRAMACIHGLNFTSTVAFLSVMRQVEDVHHYVTPSFMRRLESSKKMLVQDKELFKAVTEANPYFHDSVRLYHRFMSIAAGGDLDLLTERANWWWEEE